MLNAQLRISNLFIGYSFPCWAYVMLVDNEIDWLGHVLEN